MGLLKLLLWQYIFIAFLSILVYVEYLTKTVHGIYLSD